MKVREVDVDTFEQYIEKIKKKHMQLECATESFISCISECSVRCVEVKHSVNEFPAL